MTTWPYGMKPAAKAWEEDSGTKLETFGIQGGKAEPKSLFDEASLTRVPVHGDDCVCAGPEDGVDRVVKWQDDGVARVRAVLGWEADDQKEILVLCRIVRWGHDGVEPDADEKQGRFMRQELGIVPGSSGVVRPTARTEAGNDGSDEK